MRFGIRGIRRGFKHVDRDVAESFGSGNVKIGTFEHYRALEGERGDRREGMVSMIQQGGFTKRGDQLSTNEKGFLEAFGIDVDGSHPNTNFDIRDNWLDRELAPMYIFCCSDQPDDELAKRTNQAIFEISDLKQFGQLIAAARPDLLRSPVVKPVIYETRAGDPTRLGPLTPDPFKKSPEFASEREIRLVWPPLRWPKPFEIINVPGVVPLLTKLQ